MKGGPSPVFILVIAVILFWGAVLNYACACDNVEVNLNEHYPTYGGWNHRKGKERPEELSQKGPSPSGSYQVPQEDEAQARKLRFEALLNRLNQLVI